MIARLSLSFGLVLSAALAYGVEVVAEDPALTNPSAVAAGEVDPDDEPAAEKTIVVTAAPLPKYRVGSSDAASLVALPPEKVPFMVDTLTEDFIRERNVTDLDQLLALQPGVYQGGKTMMARNAGTYTIRGFGRNEVMMGGVPVSGGASIYMDPSLLERVDIVKGPVGGAYGGQTTNGSLTDMGGCGGTVLLTPKQASFAEDFNDFMVRGSYSKASGSRLKWMADINRVDEDETAAVRVPVAYEWREPGWAPSAARHGTMFSAAPSLSFRLLDRLTAGADFFYQYSDQPAYQGIRTAYGKPLYTGWDDTYTNPSDRMKHMTFGGTFRLDGELNDWVKTRTRASYFQTHTDYKYRGPFSNKGFNNTTKKYEWAAGDRIARNIYVSQDFIFEFETGEVEHTFLTGANVYYKRNQGRSSFSSAGPVILDTLTPTMEEQRKIGLQAQDVMQWKGFSLLAGLRADWHDSINHVHAWTYSPRLGLSYDILEEGIAYLYANASITESPNFNYKATPTTTGTAKSDYLNTTWHAVQKEVGLRVNPVGSLWASVAFFWIDQSDAPIAMTGTGTDDDYYSSDGKTSSRGVELSLSGNLTDNWSVYAAYAYSHYYDHNAHSHFDRYPPHALSLWTSYKAPWFYDAVFGFGMRWRDDWLMTFRGGAAGDDQCAKSLLTFDTSVDFPVNEFFSLGLSLKNIFDSRGIESARNLQAFANDGRTFELFMRYRF